MKKSDIIAIISIVVMVVIAIVQGMAKSEPMQINIINSDIKIVQVQK